MAKYKSRKMSNEQVVEDSKHHIIIINYFMAMRGTLFEQFNPGEGTLYQHFIRYTYLLKRTKRKNKLGRFCNILCKN